MIFLCFFEVIADGMSREIHVLMRYSNHSLILNSIFVYGYH